MVGKTENKFRILEFVIVQTISFCISTLLIWCCRLCYFSWWIRALWGDHATLVLLEKIVPSKNCASGSLQASSGTGRVTAAFLQVSCVIAITSFLQFFPQWKVI